jgi:hypothetical protein
MVVNASLLIIFTSPALAVEAGKVDFALAAPSPRVTIDTDVVVTLSINVSSTVRAESGDFEITYDAAKLGTPIITQGDFFDNHIGATTTANNKINFSYILDAPASGPRGKTGSGTVATIKFHPTVVGQTSINLTNSTVVGGNSVATGNPTNIPLGVIANPTITILSPLVGDLDHNNTVNFADYQMLTAGFGTTYNLFDFAKLVANWGKSQ